MAQLDEQNGLRPLGLHERYCLARANTGYPSRICIVARLNLADNLRAKGEPDLFHSLQQRTRKRIAHAFQHYPLLRSVIANPRAQTPRWQLLSEPSDSDALYFAPLQLGDDDSDEAVAALLLSSQHDSWKTAARTINPAHEKPLWCCTLSPQIGSDRADVWASVICDHTICDGLGALHLFELLFSSTPCQLDSVGIDGTASLDEPTICLPPTSDAVYRMSPSVIKLSKVVFNEILWPQVAGLFPSWLSHLSASVWPPPMWRSKGPPPTRWPTPTDEVPLSSVSAPPKLTVLLISDTLTQFKALTSQRGIRGLHALLHTVALVTLYTVFKPPGKSEQEKREPLLVETGTPMSVRDLSGRNLPYTTGNYVGTLGWEGTVDPDDSIWDLAKSFGAYLTHPRALSLALQNIGMLVYLPKEPPSPKAGEEMLPTGWEAFIKGKFLKSPRTAMELSNLGQLRTSGPTGPSGQQTACSPAVQGVQALCWAQAPQPSGEGLTIDLCGFGNTLSVSVGLRRQRFPPAQQAALEVWFAPVFKQVCSCLLAYHSTTGQDGLIDLTVDQLGREAWATVQQADLRQQ